MTRRQTFLIRRARYMRRRDRAYRSGWHWVIGPSNVDGHTVKKHGERVHQLRPLGMMKGQRLLSRSYNGGPFVYTGFEPIPQWEISPAGPARPPHVKFINAYAVYVYGHSWSYHWALCGFHRRRVNRWGHRPWRMTGVMRKAYGASWLAYNEGYFPEWDPLKRSPVDDGTGTVLPYSGPFPEVPRDPDAYEVEI